MRKVYIRYLRSGDSWRIVPTDMTGEHSLRVLNFKDSGKIEQLAERCGALSDLAGRQALEAGLLGENGGFQCELSEDYFAKLSLGRR